MKDLKTLPLDQALAAIQRANPAYDVKASFEQQAANLARVVARYQEQQCCAYVLKFGEVPNICSVDRRSFLRPMAPQDRAWRVANQHPVTRHDVEARLPAGELECLAARYREATNLEPEDAVLFLRMAPHRDVEAIGYECQIGYEPLTEQERLIQGPWPGRVTEQDRLTGKAQ